jgi:hypothetical protein
MLSLAAALLVVVADEGVRLSADGRTVLRESIAAGSHPDLLWPGFGELQHDLDRFYREGEFDLVWFGTSGPTRQARAVVQLLGDADDGAPWVERLARLDGAGTPDLLRRRILPAQDVAAAMAFLEPPFEAYHRTLHDVYLHGTPSPEVFRKPRRDFSHGCIRVEDPVSLAAWVLRDRPGWTADPIRQAMDGQGPLRVDLPRRIPVLILYGTAVVYRPQLPQRVRARG